MKSLQNLPMLLGVIALAIWVAYGAFVMLDLYLDYPVAGIALRLLVPWAALGNLVGIVMAIVRTRKDGKLLLAAGLILNAVPPLVMLGFLLWLFFGFRM
jgi:hypothetical protein